MTISEAVEQLGGGPTSVMIVGLAIAVVFLWRDNVKMREILIANIRTLDSAIELVRSSGGGK